MRKLAKKGGFIWVVLAIIPIAAFTHMIGDIINLSSSVILSIQLPALVLQLFSLFMMMRYRKDIFKN